MPTAFVVRALASVVRVELDDSVPPADADGIREQWIDLLDEDAEPTARIIAAVGTQPVRDDPSDVLVSAETPEHLAALLTSQITLVGIEELGGVALMLHAGAIALDDGRVIALVGPSGRGKTTATQVLGRSHGYVTDETLAVQRDGSVIPYRKPLAIGRHPEPKTPVPASVAGLGELPSAPLVLSAIVVLDRREHVAEPHVEHVPVLEALDEIVPQTSFLSKVDRPLRALVTALLAAGGVRRVVYSEAETLPGLLDAILADGPTEEPHLVDVGVNLSDCGCGSKLAAVDATDESAGSVATYRRSSYRDALSFDDALVVLGGNRVSVLEGLGPVLWLTAENSTEDELREAALRELPAPPEHVDPAQVVAAAVDELIDAKLLTRA